MDLDEYYLLLSVLFVFMLFTSIYFRSNYFIHGFWLLLFTWYGVIAMNENTDNIVYGLILICFNVLLNILFIEQARRDLRRQ